ncbi:disease resistance protein RUN1-like [Malus sylvestris]|uniref:disease resistance protein RUN1-like n=1 Tax=Malus sylvestris TaxID=3752 RepID=UPI0021ACDA03|nr:disease resistance protein RUN1-like [Malus sylvestris]
MDSSGATLNFYLRFRDTSHRQLRNTRKTFTEFLYTTFVEKGIPTFLDEEELERGEDIKPNFKKAIQQSQSSVISKRELVTLKIKAKKNLTKEIETNNSEGDISVNGVRGRQLTEEAEKGIGDVGLKPIRDYFLV